MDVKELLDKLFGDKEKTELEESPLLLTKDHTYLHVLVDNYNAEGQALLDEAEEFRERFEKRGVEMHRIFWSFATDYLVCNGLIDKEKIPSMNFTKGVLYVREKK